MSAVFDPYQAWLGIPRQEQPPHHYRLLDIAPLEGDPAVIEAAAAKQTKTLQMQAVGPYVALAQQICGEVAAARYCLVTPSAKAAYDAQLRTRLAQATAAPARPLPVAATLPANPRFPTPLPAPAPQRALPAARPQPAPQAVQQVVQPTSPAAPAFVVSAGSKPAPKAGAPTSRRPSNSGQATAGRNAFELFKIVAGAVAGLLIAVLILNYFVGIDPLGWSVSARKDDAKPKKVATAKTQVAPTRVVPNYQSFPETRGPTVSGPVAPNPAESSNSASPFRRSEARRRKMAPTRRNPQPVPFSRHPRKRRRSKNRGPWRTSLPRGASVRPLPARNLRFLPPRSRRASWRRSRKSIRPSFPRRSRERTQSS